MSRALDIVPPDLYEAGRIMASYGFALGLKRERYEASLEMFAGALAISRRRLTNRRHKPGVAR